MELITGSAQSKANIICLAFVLHAVFFARLKNTLNGFMAVYSMSDTDGLRQSQNPLAPLL